MKYLFVLIFAIGCFETIAQVTVYKKTAQRRDDYINNNWKGKDSNIIIYNNDTIQTCFQAIQFTANNIWENWYKYTYTINGLGKVSTQLRENWVAGNWVNSNRYTYTYDGTGNNLLILYDVWNNNIWNQTGKIEYTNYNNFGKPKFEYVSTFSGGNWVYQTMRDKIYINNETLTSDDDKYLWDIPTNNWKKWERFYYTYIQNEFGTITHLLPDFNGIWQPKNKYLYSYNMAPQLISEYRAQIFDTSLVSWVDDSRVVYSYTPNNLLDKTQNEYFSANTWIPTVRDQTIYNGLNEKSEYYTENFTGVWTKNTRSTYQYANSKVIEEKQYQGIGNVWVDKKKLSYNYDANGNLIYELNQDYVGANLIPFSQAFYYYNAFTVDVKNVANLFTALNIYPNPTQENLQIEINSEKNSHLQIKVLNVFGNTNLIVTQPIFKNKNHIQIPCSSLSNGFYLIQFTDLQNGKTQTEKFQISK